MSRPLLLAAPIVFLLLWSAGFAIAKIGLQHAGPFTLLALRYTIAVLVLLPLVPLLKPAFPRGRAAVDIAVVGAS
jgi:drug/metabolite transporter (DMT)-like permease